MARLPLGEKITDYDTFIAKHGDWVRQYQHSRHDQHDNIAYWAIGQSLYQPALMRNPASATTVHKHTPNGQHGLSNYLPKSKWWFLREYLRWQSNAEAYGNVLSALWNTGWHTWYCPRPHVADPTKVEFFPDEQAAIAERPIVTSIAKFLRRACPMYSDDYIREMDVAYRAEQSNEVEFLEGIDGLRAAYHPLNPVTSCMSKYFYQEDNLEYRNYEGHHPVDAYDTPGIKVAVGRDVAGKINARCMVYVNPENPDDKRMIRTYGDASLTARLQRNGFQWRPFDGLRLRAIHSDSLDAGLLPEARKTGARVYILPYLDGVQGKHSNPDAARYVVHVEGEDTVRLITSASCNQLNAEFNKASDAPRVKEIYATNVAETLKMTPDEVQRELDRDVKAWAAVVKATGVRLD